MKFELGNEPPQKLQKLAKRFSVISNICNKISIFEKIQINSKTLLYSSLFNLVLFLVPSDSQKTKKNTLSIPKYSNQ